MAEPYPPHTGTMPPADNAAALRGKEDALTKDILTSPDRFTAYAGLAGVQRKQQQNRTALGFLGRALTIAPEIAELHHNHGNLALIESRAGNPEAAFRKSLMLTPSLLASWRKLALLDRGLGRNVEAAEKLRRALICAGRTDETLAVLRERLELLILNGEPDRARSVLCELLSLAGGDPDILNTLVLTLTRLDFKPAGLTERLVKRLALANPAAFRAYYIQAQISLEAQNLIESRTHLTRTQIARPLFAPLYSLFGSLEEREDNRASSIDRYRKALVLSPEISDLSYNLGVAERSNRNPESGLRYYRHALTIAPENPVYRFNYALCLLIAGRLQDGLAEYEKRWASPGISSDRRGQPGPSFPMAFWQGEPLDGKTLLIWGEQGLGDETWFAGYLPMLIATQKADRYIVECDARLQPALAAAMPDILFVPRTAPPDRAVLQADVQCAMGSLPFLISKTNAPALEPQPIIFPQARPYLSNTPIKSNRHARFFAKAPTEERKIVGISWRSDKPDPSKSFEAPILTWESLLTRPDLDFVSLQYGSVESDMEIAKTAFGAKIYTSAAPSSATDPNIGIEDLLDRISICDVVVSIANSTIMLAHALGKPCHVTLRETQEDWRYIQGKSHSPWLPTCQLYWPDRTGGWERNFRLISDRL